MLITKAQKERSDRNGLRHSTECVSLYREEKGEAKTYQDVQAKEGTPQQIPQRKQAIAKVLKVKVDKLLE